MALFTQYIDSVLFPLGFLILSLFLVMTSYKESCREKKKTQERGEKGDLQIKSTFQLVKISTMVFNQLVPKPTLSITPWSAQNRPFYYSLKHPKPPVHF